MKTITIGVLGCGAFGEKHIASFSQMDHVNLKKICDINEVLTENIANKYKVKQWVKDYKELLEDPDIDAISVVTPEKYHFEHTMLALQNNKHVLVEKPMAMKEEQAEQLIKEANIRNLVLMPGHILRFETSYIIAKERLKSMGKIHSIHAKRNLPKNMRSIYTRVHPTQLTLIHDIDVVLWMLDSLPKKVYAIDRP